MFSYQCSHLSTPQSIIEVFNTAKAFQKNQDTTNYVSVVVLDEVGLAEDSPNLPLKALHPLLEDGTAGTDDNEEVDVPLKYYYYVQVCVCTCVPFLLIVFGEKKKSCLYWNFKLGPRPCKDESWSDGNPG